MFLSHFQRPESRTIIIELACKLLLLLTTENKIPPRKFCRMNLRKDHGWIGGILRKDHDKLHGTPLYYLQSTLPSLVLWRNSSITIMRIIKYMTYKISLTIKATPKKARVRHRMHYAASYCVSMK